MASPFILGIHPNPEEDGTSPNQTLSPLPAYITFDPAHTVTDTATVTSTSPPSIATTYTTNPSSLYAYGTQSPQSRGPPTYYTASVLTQDVGGSPTSGGDASLQNQFSGLFTYPNPPNPQSHNHSTNRTSPHFAPLPPSVPVPPPLPLPVPAQPASNTNNTDEADLQADADSSNTTNSEHPIPIPIPIPIDMDTDTSTSPKSKIKANLSKGAKKFIIGTLFVAGAPVILVGFIFYGLGMAFKGVGEVLTLGQAGKVSKRVMQEVEEATQGGGGGTGGTGGAAGGGGGGGGGTGGRKRRGT